MKPDLGRATPGADGGSIPLSKSLLVGCLAVSLFLNVVIVSWYVASVSNVARETASRLDPVVHAELARWISDARDVARDRFVEKLKIDDVFGMVEGDSAARNYLDAWYPAAGHSPFDRAKDGSVSTVVDSIVPIDKKTYLVAWTETIRDLKGHVTGTQHWQATIGVAFAPPADEAAIDRNPIGMYVTDLTWAQKK